MKSGISVIVCCYNSQARLPETLRHLICQKVLDVNWEIIIVDNASKDNTAVLAKQLLQNSGIPYKVVHENKPGLIHARHKGYQTAQYDYLLFCDDDNWLDENYLQIANNIIRNNCHIGMLGGIGEAVFENIHPTWFEKYQDSFAVGPQSNSSGNLVKVKALYGAGVVMQRQIFTTLQQMPFESLLTGRKGNMVISGDDTELCYIVRYLGYEILYSPGLKFKHLMTDSRMNWAYLKKLYFGFGRSRVYIHAYDKLEDNSTIPGQNLRLPLWLEKYLYLLKELRKFLPGVLFRLNLEGDETVLKYQALKGELFELKNLKDDYVNVFKKILDTKAKIDQLKK
jgi:glycosyltransferase involved in cell wall biosynthesis